MMVPDLLEPDRAAPLSVRGLVKSFGTQPAVDQVSFDLAPGTVTGLLGANGSGKTTLVHLALGLLQPDRGTASVFGLPAGSDGARQSSGVMLQDAELPPLLKVRELVSLFRKGYAGPMDEREVRDVAGLDAIYEKRYGNLSGGEKRRAQCALALCGNPRLLLLDEPTVHMDMGSKEVFWNAVYAMRGKGCCVVVVSHQRDEVQALADSILLMANGRIVSHTALAQGGVDAGLSRISFADTAGVCRDDLLALDYVRELRQVGRVTEATVTDVAAFVALLGKKGVNMAGVAIAPALPEASRPASGPFEHRREAV